jgi:hypothetical protein
MSLWEESAHIGAGRAMWFNARGGNSFQEAPPMTTSAPAFARRGLFICDAMRLNADDGPSMTSPPS